MSRGTNAVPSHTGAVLERTTPRIATSGALTTGVNPVPPIPPVVNAPEVAILGVVRSRTAPVWDGTAFVPRLMLPLSLSYDHRVIDGALAARFTRYLCYLLEDVRRLML